MVETDPQLVYSIRRDAPVSEPPSRTISLVPSVTESLFELHLGDRVVAVTDDCRFPEQALQSLARIGPANAPKVDHIAALQPDLVIVNRDENRPEDIEALTARGVPVWVTGPRTVREAFNLLWAVMDLYETPTMVEAIRAIEWQCDWLERLDESRRQVCRVFVLTGVAPLTTLGGDSFASDLLRVCGGHNVFANRAQHAQGGLPVFPEVTADEVGEVRPDIILIPSGRPDLGLTDYARQLSPESHIRFIDESLLFWHGTRMSRAFKALPGELCALDTVYNTDG